MTVAPGTDDLFSLATFFPAGNGPRDIVSGDWNEDGDPDLAVVNYYDGNVTVLNGRGDGSFYVGAGPAAGYYPVSIATEDFDGDHHLDLVATNVYDDEFSVLLGNGNGNFVLDERDATGDYPYSVAAGDLENDGDIDLAISAAYDGKIFIHKRTSENDFVMDGNFTVSGSPMNLALRDLDDDQDLDLAVGTSSGMSILEWEGGDFLSPVHYYISGSSHDLAIGNLNNEDEHLDIALANSSYDRVDLLKGLGNCDFEVVGTADAGDNPYGIAMGDINLDGYQDLAVVNYYSDEVAVLLGKGNFEFKEPMHFACGNAPYAILLADFDKDADLDIATANYYGDTVAVLLNNTQENKSIVTGPGKGEANPPLVRVFNPAYPVPFLHEWYAYSVYRYGVNVATGSLDQDWGFEIVTGPGPGRMFSPHVRGFEKTGLSLYGLSFVAYGTKKYGVNVACGDIDGDGFDEIITGPGPGAVFGPHVRGWDWDGSGPVEPIEEVSFLAYGTKRWGSNVSCGDIDGDHFDEIITGPGPGPVFGPHVRGWDWDGTEEPVRPIHRVSFFAYETRNFGVNVSCGNIDGDNCDEIVTGPGPCEFFGPHVRGWNWDGNPGTAEPIPGVSFLAYGQQDIQWGVQVSCGRVDNDLSDDMVTGPGPGDTYGAWVKGFSYDGIRTRPINGIDFFAYMSDITHGVNVSVARIK